MIHIGRRKVQFQGKENNAKPYFEKEDYKSYLGNFLPHPMETHDFIMYIMNY